MIEIFTEAFAAGETKTFMVQGEYLEILEAAYPVTVYMMDRSGAQLSTMRNAEASFFSKPGKYEVVQVQSAQAQTVRIFIGSGDAGTRRTAGVVSVVDGGKARTISSQAFAWANGSPPVAAKYSVSQLYNPVGSGKRVTVKAFSVIAGGATSIVVHTVNTAASTPAATQPTNSKYPGGMAPLAASRYDNLVAPTASPNYIDYLSFPAIGTTSKVLQEPIVLNPGYGLNAETTTVNQLINTSYEWTEETI